MLLCSSSNQQPWNPSLAAALSLLRKCHTLTDVNQAHAWMITTGLIRSRALSAKIVVDFVSSPREPVAELARRVFFACRARNDEPFLWNAVMKSFSHGREPVEALVLFRLMLENGVFVDEFSFSLVLKACGRLGLSKEGSQVHGLLKKMGFESDLYLHNSLISWYLRCGSLEFAFQVFDKMSQRDSVSYNVMIDGFVKRRRVERARELFDSMPVRERNLVTWNSMISGYAQFGDGLKLAWDLFETMPKRDLVSWNTMIDGFVKGGKLDDARNLFSKMPERDVISCSNLIDGYLKSGRVGIARSLFDEMPEKDVVTYNAMMAGYIGNGYYAKALEIFQNMSKDNILPDDTTLLSVLSAITQLGQIERGANVHSYIEENGFSLSGKLGVSLIDMYAKCGSIEKAITVFENLQKRKVDHWNAMIGGFAVHGMGESAFLLLMEMERLSVRPDDITFIGVLTACGHVGLVKEGMMCFELMRRVHKVYPKMQHYGCMVNILGRAGLVKEAWRFINEMPIEPNDIVWRTLLSSCKIHENFDIGEPIAKNLITRDSCSPSFYVLLSNMYASLGMWDDVRKLRLTMRERNITKLPGCSRIEIKGNLHEFLVQDRSHPQVQEIYSVLNGSCPSGSQFVIV